MFYYCDTMYMEAKSETTVKSAGSFDQSFHAPAISVLGSGGGMSPVGLLTGCNLPLENSCCRFSRSVRYEDFKHSRMGKH